MTISRFIEEHISALNGGMAPNSGQSIPIAAWRFRRYRRIIRASLAAGFRVIVPDSE